VSASPLDYESGKQEFEPFRASYSNQALTKDRGVGFENAYQAIVLSYVF
jgi:hypothetical protein